MLAQRGLPGIRIDVAPPPPTEVLPRMDIAVFVGFASTGPTHFPVAIESVAQYAAVFGPDAPLAWDAVRSEQVYANLGPCVRSFFSNGGRRCFVIRVTRTLALEAAWRRPPAGAVAGHGIAVANKFAIPGVLVVPRAGSPPGPALAQARSVGSWSDPLALSTALVSMSFSLSGATDLAAPRIGFTTDAALTAGDLVVFGDPGATSAGATQIYATIDQVVMAGGTASLSRQVQATICATFTSLDVTSPPSVMSGSVEVAGVTAGAVAATLAINPSPNVATRLRFDGALPSGLAAGPWARWSGAGLVVWMRIDSIDRGAAAADGIAWREAPLNLPSPMPSRASVLTLDLRVAGAAGDMARLRGVGLTPAHDASWWAQVSDDVAYAHDDGIVPSGQSSSGPGFPLAALDTESGDGAPLALIPLGVSGLYGAPVSPSPQSATQLERDGLARFDAELFLDPGLATAGIDALIEQADVIRFLGSSPRPLFGLHAALSIGESGLYNEATLLAIPDAVHVGWARRNHVQAPPATSAPQAAPAHWFTHRGPCAAAPKEALATQPDFGNFLDCGTRALAAPRLTGPADAVPLGPFLLTWSASEQGATYVVQEAWRPDFGNAREIYRGEARTLDVEPTREGIFYYQVSALAGDEQSQPSNVVPVVVRDDEWIEAEPAAFAAGGERELTRIHRAALRLAAASGELFTVLGLPRHYRAPDAISYSGRLRAEPDDAAADADAFDFNERRALSFGALMHPWALFGQASGVVPDRSGQLTILPQAGAAQRACPPDGIVTGMLAARANARGAWIAPANEPFKDVVALTPQIGTDAWLALQDAQVNLIRADTRGFLTLAADTLSDDDQLEWRPINVRRLMILLRRLALRRGTNYVFEPNGDALRRSVRRGFTLLLTDLFRQGAFAGDTVAESFKVVTDETINTAAARDAGRCLVELQVAPSLPLQFLNVRLVQSGERLTVAEGQ